ncbi:ABC transporter ATP-binding protein [Streptomyces sp. NPDC059349]|uniref:ABC transporter ATP-binding protein n=1 Tax=Streptomyces sp. NPDC059349 TaxID=3346808 RepID=UPI0036753403
MLLLTAFELFALFEPTAVALVTGALVGQLSDAVRSGQGDFDGLLTPVVTLGLLLLAGNVIRALSWPLAHILERRIESRIRTELMERALALPALTDLESQEFADDAATVRSPAQHWTGDGIGAGAIAAYRSLLMLVGMVSTMLVLSSINWWWGPAVAVCALVLGRLRVALWVEFEKTTAAAQPGMRSRGAWAKLITGGRDAKEVRLFGLGGWLDARLEEGEDTWWHGVLATRERVIRREQAVFVGWAVTAAVAYVAVGRSDALSVGDAAAALGAVGAMFAISMNTYGEDVIELAAPSAAALRRLRRTAPARVRPEPEPGRDGGRTELRDVTFRYPNSPVPVLDGLSLTLRPGQVVAVVGGNGAGKSTLVKVVTGQYVPESGTAVVDPSAYAVYQDFARYELSALENVRIAAPSASDEQVMRALATAGAEELIASLPAGAHTVLAGGYTEGVGLSGGQWQKIALARAMLAADRGARLLVLDEPTANLDIEAELAAFELITQARNGASVLLISHRFSTVRKADRIIVLDGGRIAEDGTHDELLAANGEYARMFTLQAHQFGEIS